MRLLVLAALFAAPSQSSGCSDIFDSGEVQEAPPPEDLCLLCDREEACGTVVVGGCREGCEHLIASAHCVRVLSTVTCDSLTHEALAACLPPCRGSVRRCVGEDQLVMCENGLFSRVDCEKLCRAQEATFDSCGPNRGVDDCLCRRASER